MNSGTEGQDDGRFQLAQEANDLGDERRGVDLIERSVSKEIPIIPFRVQNTPPVRALDFYLSNTHWLDAFDPPLDDHVALLANAIRRLLPDRAFDVGARPSTEGRASLSRRTSVEEER